jgi:hypothetical protein
MYEPTYRVHVFARTRSEAYVMEAGSRLIEVLVAIVLSRTHDPKTGSPADAIEVIVSIVDDFTESQKR